MTAPGGEYPAGRLHPLAAAVEEAIQEHERRYHAPTEALAAVDTETHPTARAAASILENLAPSIRDGEIGASLTLDDGAVVWMGASAWEGVRDLIRLRRNGESAMSWAVEHFLEVLEDQLKWESPFREMLPILMHEMAGGLM